MTDDWKDTIRGLAKKHQALLTRLGNDMTDSTLLVRHNGRVKWFNRMRGHGFIAADDPELTDGYDIFVHYTAIEGDGRRNLYEHDRVSFTLHDFGKGPQAQNVRRLT